MAVQFGIILRLECKQGNAEGMLLNQQGKVLSMFGMGFISANAI